MLKSSSSTATLRPTVDEWGFYDPQQAGLVALYTRLSTPLAQPSADALAEGTRTRIIGEPPPSNTPR
jgi:hypothetical protein